MGGWSERAYLHCEDLDRIEQGFNKVMEQEDFCRVSVLPPPVQTYGDIAYQNPYLGNLRGLELSPGVPGWTIVEPVPHWLFNWSAAEVSRPLIAEVAAAVGCDAFQINVYDGDSIVLLEANAQGDYAFSGGGFSARQAIDNLEELIPDQYYCQESFRLIEVPEKVKEVLVDEDLDDDSRAGQIYVTLWDNPEIEDLTPYIRKLYFWRKDVPFPTEVGSSSLVS